MVQFFWYRRRGLRFLNEIVSLQLWVWCKSTSLTLNCTVVLGYFYITNPASWVTWWLSANHFLVEAARGLLWIYFEFNYHMNSFSALCTRSQWATSVAPIFFLHERAVIELKSENKFGLHKSENKFALHKSENEFALLKSENEFNPNPSRPTQKRNRELKHYVV